MTDDINWHLRYAGDRCVVFEFGQTIDKTLVDKIVALDRQIHAAMLIGELDGITETVPTFRSLAVIFDPLLAHPDDLVEKIRHLDPVADSDQSAGLRQWQIPVHYGDQSGPDLESVAKLTGLDPQQVLTLHQQTLFTVYMLGFLPGFAFLGDTPPQLHLPRRTEPRLRVPAGSVAIAMQLTGVYPWDSPGGWHILGNCPVPLFNGQLNPPALLRAGDSIRFHGISAAEHQAIVQQVQSHTFERESLLAGALNAS